jgi:GNAT superfamily N-acetyltransferase
MSPDPDITIRRPTADDSHAIAAILRELGWFAYMREESPGDTAARVARHMEMCTDNESHTVLVAEYSPGAVVGYVAVHWLPYMMHLGPEGFVSELFVLQPERGKGIGRSLLDAVEEHARERGCSRLHLITGRQRDSFGFYQELGWHERPEIADLILPLS